MSFSEPNTATAASRLCNQCGLCCNGVLFHNVRLQPDDVAADLVKLGLHVQRKKGGHLFQQPCPAYRESCCSIYADRPTRCRLFACQQLQHLAEGQITESEALEKIRDVKARVRRITVLLEQAGPTNPRRPLGKRYEKILATPAFDAGTVQLHEKLTEEMTALEAILDTHFRVPADPSGDVRKAVYGPNTHLNKRNQT